MGERIERDALGLVSVPETAYWGAATQRAINNFKISGQIAHPALLAAMVNVKKATARANGELGVIPADVAKAIQTACDEVLDNKMDGQFPVDVFQMGAGTAFHMNVNEVLANRAIEILGGRRGDYGRVNPNDHVNRGQSTNDCFPTAMRVAAAKLALDLETELGALAEALQAKATALSEIVKAGRTHLMDAAPVTLGQEVAAWAATVLDLRAELAHGRNAVCEVGLGGSAVGTGINTLSGFREKAIAHLAALTGLPLRPTADLHKAMQSQLPIGILSSAMRSCALELVRITNDMRLLGSGPACGLGELRLPEVAPGSSIMPGKVNPSIPEMVAMVMYHVTGLDTSIALALQAGQLELNVMMPLMAFSLNQGLSLSTAAVRTLRERCVADLEADTVRCRRAFASTSALATVLTPRIGYAAASEVVKEAVRTGRTIPDLVVSMGLLTSAEADAMFDPAPLVHPHEAVSRNRS